MIIIIHTSVRSRRLFSHQATIQSNHYDRRANPSRTGGAIYTLGAEGNLPFQMPAKFTNTSAILPPSVQLLNYVHDAGTDETASLDHDGIGAGSHSPGGIYTDEGSVRANLQLQSSTPRLTTH